MENGHTLSSHFFLVGVYGGGFTQTLNIAKMSHCAAIIN